jgi:hypothetical protein
MSTASEMSPVQVGKELNCGYGRLRPTRTIGDVV